MDRTHWGCLTLAVLASVIPTDVSAQMMGYPPPPGTCTISQTRPVVTTQLRPQQVTSFCEVTETQVSHRQVVENIPITTCKNVTVDEGGYQTVWVPKPVTKQVAQTVMQQQVKTVAVPVQVKRRVPSTVTQMVPVQSVQYVTEHVPLQMTAMANPGCSTCGGGGMAFAAPMMAPQMGYVPPSYQPSPYSSAAIPVMPTISVPMSRTASSPSPLSRTDSVRSQANSNTYDSDNYETVHARGVPVPRDEAISPAREPIAPNRGASRFTGVPSAAAVWQSQNAR